MKRLVIDVTVFAVIAAGIIAAALWSTPDDAAAHTPNPAACRIAWEQAPDGHRHEALVACRRAQAAHTLRHLCSQPRPLVPRTVRVKGVTASRHQRAVLTRSLNLARKRHASPTVAVALVAAETQESSARNIPYGHGTSVGVLQLIDTHGSFAWRMVIENSVGWHLDRSIPLNRRYPNVPPGDLAQLVQASGHPTLYRQWVPEAKRTYRAFLGPCRR